jgi:hypothetical protein
MSMFGKKRETRDTMRGGYDGIAGESAPSATSHRLTLDLSRAMDLATMLASSRASQFIEITDLLAGLYIYEWDRLASYWPEENREHVEEMLQEICQISPQRWNYWITLYDAQRKEGEPQPRWKQFGKLACGLRRCRMGLAVSRLESRRGEKQARCSRNSRRDNRMYAALHCEIHLIGSREKTWT